MPDAPWWQRATRADRAIVAYAVALLVVWSPSLNLGLLTPRIALVFAGIGPGLVVVSGLARRGDRTARIALLFLGWALVSVAASRHARLAFVGGYGADIGWVYLAGFLAAWGLGRRLSDVGRRLLMRALMAGLAVNIFFAVLEAVLEPGGKLGAVDGRVQGLMSYSLFLAGLLAGLLALTGCIASRRSVVGRRLAVVLALTAAASLAVNLTGSRAALVGGAVLAVLGAWVTARVDGATVSRAGRSAVLVGLAVVVGFLVSIPIQSGTSGTGRLDNPAAASGGFESRQTMWSIGLRELRDRPLVGFGPGRFREATEPSTPASFVRAEGPDRPFYDAHNLVVELAVTTGVVGLVLAVAFAWSAGRAARGPLAWFTVGVALTWIFNPMSVCTAPIALLALGAAHRRSGRPPGPDAPTGETTEEVDGVVAEPVDAELAEAVPRSHRTAQVVGAVLCLLGAAAGVTLLLADAAAEQATKTGDVDAAARAAGLIPFDATLAGLEADARTLVVRDDPSPANLRALRKAADRPIELDPTRPNWFVQRGYTQATFGPGDRAARLERGAADFDRALELNPWSVAAMSARHAVAEVQHDDAEAARLRARLCAVDACPED